MDGVCPECGRAYDIETPGGNDTQYFDLISRLMIGAFSAYVFRTYASFHFQQELGEIYSIVIYLSDMIGIVFFMSAIIFRIKWILLVASLSLFLLDLISGNHYTMLVP